MNNECTYAELEIRKWWLRIFLILVLFEMIDRIDTIVHAGIPENAMLLGIGLGFLYKAMFYYYGYLKRGIKFLTCALFLFVFETGLQIGSFFFDGLSLFQMLNAILAKMHPIFLFLSYVIYFAFFYATILLRKINKIRKKANNSLVLI